MNPKLKTLLVITGAALLAMPAVQAQRAGSGSRGNFSGGSRGGGAAARSALALRSSGSAFHGNHFTNGRLARSGYYGRGSYASRGNGHHHYGRYYYLGGIPYYYPFFGYGYGGFYGDGFYGDGFYGPYGSGYLGGTYEGRINGRSRDDDDDNDRDNAPAASAGGSSLPSAVQRQLSKRGYYKGKVDGQFGSASRDALSRFQKSQDLKPTGRIDEDTLDALGFTDRR